jgi:uncharacterized small protein (TIGR04563 family)
MIAEVMPDDMLKQSLYFPQEMLEEIKDEAKRLERSTSWVVTKAWKLARDKIRKMKATDSGQ